MATLTIRNLDEDTKTRLRIRAAKNGRSMEEEARTLLATAVRSRPGRPVDLAASIRRRFEPFGGVELEMPAREPGRDPPGVLR
jgi:antitoxin FitA